MHLDIWAIFSSICNWMIMLCRLYSRWTQFSNYLNSWCNRDKYDIWSRNLLSILNGRLNIITMGHCQVCLEECLKTHIYIVTTFPHLLKCFCIIQSSIPLWGFCLHAALQEGKSSIAILLWSPKRAIYWRKPQASQNTSVQCISKPT